MIFSSTRLYQAALISAVGALAFGACTSDSSTASKDNTTESSKAGSGSVGLQLTLPDGSTVTTVAWTLSKAGATVLAGNAPVPANGVVTIAMADIKVGTGYTLSMSGARTGVTPAKDPCTGSSLPFAVVENQTTAVSVYMQCGDLDAVGNINAEGRFNFCPRTPSIVATPTTAAIGATIALTALSVDQDGGTVSYLWSAPSGTFSPVNAGATTFTCVAPGTIDLKVTVDDGQGCTTKAHTIPVTCTGVVVEVDAGPVAVDAGPVAVDAGPVAVDAGPVAVDAGPAPVDAGPPPVARLGNLSAACLTCLEPCNAYGDDALPLLDLCKGSAVAGYTTVDTALCGAVLDCSHTNNCGLTGLPEDCYCGTVTGPACFTAAGGANGACKSQYEAATGTTDPVLVGGRLAALAYPAGPAAGLLVCENILGCASTCSVR